MLQLSSCSPPASLPPQAEWWEALVPIPDDAAVLNFVVSVYDHYDNNDRQDFKVRAGVEVA